MIEQIPRVVRLIIVAIRLPAETAGAELADVGKANS